MNKDQDEAREESIKIIEKLYPADSEYTVTKQVGIGLLLKAIDLIGWRELPTSIITEYAKLCRNEKSSQKNIPRVLRTDFSD